MPKLPSRQNIVSMAPIDLSNAFIESFTKVYSYNPVTREYTFGIESLPDPVDSKSMGSIIPWLLAKGYYVGFKPSDDGKMISVEVFKEFSVVVNMAKERLETTQENVVRAYLLYLSEEERLADEKKEKPELVEKKK